MGAGVTSGVGVAVAVGVAVVAGVGATVGVASGVAVASGSGVVAAGEGVGAVGSVVAPGVVSVLTRGVATPRVSPSGLPSGCPQSAVTVTGGDAASALKRPNVDPIGDPRSTISPTPRRSAA